MTKRNVAIFIFDEVEILDFAGPYEVFAVAHKGDGEHLFNVYTVSVDGKTVQARNGLSVNPAYSFANMPKPDILLTPGGNGTRALLKDDTINVWLQEQAASAELMLSVCTGALLLGRAGLLSGLGATTYHTAFDLLQSLDPSITLHPGERWVDNGHVVTSAGVSAGIDMSLHIVGRLHGRATADTTARYMEYTHWPQAES